MSVYPSAVCWIESDANVTPLSVTVFDDLTVTVARALAVPADEVAVNVYVVVWAGLTTVWLVTGTAPTPLSIEAAVAPKVDHFSVALWPRSIVAGSALKAEMPKVGVAAGNATAELLSGPCPMPLTAATA